MRSPFRRRRTGETRARHEGATAHRPAPSLAKPPAMIVGAILVGFGLAALVDHNTFPPTSGFPDADVDAGTFLGLETNGWTNWAAIATGAVLLFGTAYHALAKTMSVIVGLTLGAGAMIGLIDGDILGLGAVNGWTLLALGTAAAVLLVTALMPRAGRRRDDHAVAAHERRGDAAQRERRVVPDERTEVVGPHDPATRSERFAREEGAEHPPRR